jgi:hypothetical protein
MLFHSPRIVTDGLVLYLDAANGRSYPGSGTTWSDLSGNGNNGTLVNGPTFNTGSLGSIQFDGVNDYCDIFAPNLTTTTTIEMWTKLGSGYAGNMIFGWNIYDIWCQSGGHIGYNTGNSDLHGISSTTVSSLGLINNWNHYVFEMRSDVSYTNNKIYINTNSQNLSQILASENSSVRNFNNGFGRISSWRFSNDYYMPQDCSYFRIYNRALTDEEIKQNFNATRGRFGL